VRSQANRSDSLSGAWSDGCAGSLTARQNIIREATVTGRPFLAPELKDRLGEFEPPAYYLDFEAMMPPIPLYEGTWPYQTIPFQWSLHRLAADGTLHHHEFLADGAGDPRRAFAETLIAALAADDAPIVVYSSYEKTRLNDLAGEFPDLRKPGVLIRLDLFYGNLGQS